MASELQEIWEELHNLRSDINLLIILQIIQTVAIILSISCLSGGYK